MISLSMLGNSERLSSLHLAECKALFSSVSRPPALYTYYKIHLAMMLLCKSIMKGFGIALLSQLLCMIYCSLLEATSHYTVFYHSY